MKIFSSSIPVRFTGRSRLYRGILFLATVSLFLFSAGCDRNEVTASGLKYEITKKTRGEKPPKGAIVKVHYKGTLEDGTVFDSSYKRNRPFQFKLGAGQVIKGWDEGIALLRKGEKATLTVPPELGYGGRSVGKIPPNSTLIFEVELVDFQTPPAVTKIEIPQKGKQTTASGLVYYDIKKGDGASPKKGQVVTVHYDGQLPSGKQFDSSRQRGNPFRFQLGKGRVIKGWEEGVAGMRKGGRRILVIPPELGYGDKGAGGVIPPGATLVFRIDLIDFK